MHGHHTLTVSTKGTDQGNCRWSPCQTLGYALTQAGPNDTIVMRPGTYPESGNANVVPPGLTGLRIKSAGWGRTVIDATGNNNGILVWASGVSVTGLTVKPSPPSVKLVNGHPHARPKAIQWRSEAERFSLAPVSRTTIS